MYIYIYVYQQFQRGASWRTGVPFIHFYGWVETNHPFVTPGISVCGASDFFVRVINEICLVTISTLLMLYVKVQATHMF